MNPQRRHVLLAGAASLAGCGPALVKHTGPEVARFDLGIASGQPSATGVVLWTVWRGHAASGVLAGVAVRLLLEAATWPYYTAAFVLGAFMWDALESRWRRPWATVAAATLLVQPAWIASADVRAVLRLVACLGALELVRRTAARTVAGGAGGPADGSAEGGAGAAGAGEHVLVEGHAEPGQVAQFDPAAV